MKRVSKVLAVCVASSFAAGCADSKRSSKWNVIAVSCGSDITVVGPGDRAPVFKMDEGQKAAKLLLPEVTTGACAGSVSYSDSSKERLNVKYARKGKTVQYSNGCANQNLKLSIIGLLVDSYLSQKVEMQKHETKAQLTLESSSPVRCANGKKGILRIDLMPAKSSNIDYTGKIIVNNNNNNNGNGPGIGGVGGLGGTNATPTMPTGLGGQASGGNTGTPSSSSQSDSELGTDGSDGGTSSGEDPAIGAPPPPPPPPPPPADPVAVFQTQFAASMNGIREGTVPMVKSAILFNADGSRKTGVPVDRFKIYNAWVKGSASNSSVRTKMNQMQSNLVSFKAFLQGLHSSLTSQLAERNATGDALRAFFKSKARSAAQISGRLHSNWSMDDESSSILDHVNCANQFYRSMEQDFAALDRVKALIEERMAAGSSAVEAIQAANRVRSSDAPAPAVDPQVHQENVRLATEARRYGIDVAGKSDDQIRSEIQAAKARAEQQEARDNAAAEAANEAEVNALFNGTEIDPELR